MNNSVRVKVMQVIVQEEDDQQTELCQAILDILYTTEVPTSLAYCIYVYFLQNNNNTEISTIISPDVLSPTSWYKGFFPRLGPMLIAKTFTVGSGPICLHIVEP
jgi:hypothetical protein